MIKDTRRQWSAWDWLASLSRTQTRMTISCCPAPIREESRSWEEWGDGRCQLPFHSVPAGKVPSDPMLWVTAAHWTGSIWQASLYYHSLWQNMEAILQLKCLGIIYSWQDHNGDAVVCFMKCQYTQLFSHHDFLQKKPSILFYILTSLFLKQICLGLSSPRLGAKPT